MTKKRIVDNRERPAQPEPDEDEAVHAPPVREQARLIEEPRRADRKTTYEKLRDRRR